MHNTTNNQQQHTARTHRFLCSSHQQEPIVSKTSITSTRDPPSANKNNCADFVISLFLSAIAFRQRPPQYCPAPLPHLPHNTDLYSLLSFILFRPYLSHLNDFLSRSIKIGLEFTAQAPPRVLNCSTNIVHQPSLSSSYEDQLLVQEHLHVIASNWKDF